MNRLLPTLTVRVCCVLLFFSAFTTSAFAQAPEPTSTLPFAVYMEAECAAVGANWRKQSDSLASDTFFVVVQPGLSSLDSPPEDVAANKVTFTVSVQERDSFKLWARVLANNPSEDSYWVRVNDGEWVKWFSRLRFEGQWIWREVQGSPFFLDAGTNTIDFAYRESNTRLDKIYVSSLRSAPQGADTDVVNCEMSNDCERFPEDCAGEVWIEAECGVPDSTGFIYRNDTRTSNSGYFEGKQPSSIGIPTAVGEPGQIEYTIDVDQDGTYYMYFLMATPDVGKNSFYVKVDDNDWIDFSNELGGGALLADDFEWKQVNNTGDTVTVDLTAGQHTLYVAKREAGTQLDKIHLRQDTIAPTGFGKVALNCAVNALTPVRAPLDLQSQLSLFPNPASSRLNVQFNSPAVRGQVLLHIVDMTGRVLSQQVFSNTAGYLNIEVSVQDLSPGLYRVLLTSDLGVSSRPFVKQ
ncbi:hypothetical protein LEM8419_02903 [Neolewinella maritima]|uniref:Secretion system C-terminal sorting domain-containing protein n=1 Tax=Neolewinella maritima TaxID=1383882 RepID=A0ABM9B3S8_9BACT|nr:T9SS type A sorting domain-containing protein [Neolewinella maritima]CAH1001988.1 hypothetical protein LEM8419_02903 [Neolewinella maritima]